MSDMGWNRSNRHPRLILVLSFIGLIALVALVIVRLVLLFVANEKSAGERQALVSVLLLTALIMVISSVIKLLSRSSNVDERTL
jgi:hypothetical protein